LAKSESKFSESKYRPSELSLSGDVPAIVDGDDTQPDSEEYCALGGQWKARVLFTIESGRISEHSASSTGLPGLSHSRSKSK